MGHGKVDMAKPLQGGLDAISDRPCNVIHSMPCKNPCRVCVHDNVFQTLRPPPSNVEVNLDSLGPFDQ